MAQATVTVNVILSYNDGGAYRVYGTLSISAGPDTYVTGGLTLNFNSNALIKATRTPVQVEIFGKGGYVYSFSKGSAANNGKLIIYTGAAAQSPLTELTNGAAIPAAVSSDVIDFSAIFKGQF